MTEKKTERVAVRMTPTLKAAATEIAASENRTLSNYIESLIVEQVQKIKKYKIQPLQRLETPRNYHP